MNEKALFIGPFGENREVFAKYVNTILEDVIQWRRNFHPNDPRLISAKEQRDEPFLDTQDAIAEALERLLGEMKQSVPFHSPRFLGHMHSDLAIPALLGYLTGMLYNQNNVVGESSPITTRKEIEFSTKMCAMLGYKVFSLKHEEGGRAWGHLCSGGTAANLEAVWIARNMKYYPISIKLMLLQSVKLTVEQKKKIEAIEVCYTTLGEISFSDLFNLSCAEIVALKDAAIKAISASEKGVNASKIFEEAIDEYDVRHLGVAGIHQEVRVIDEKELPLPKLYVSTAGHYSWEKCLDIVGIGKSNVCRIEVDTHFQMHQGKFREALNKNKENAVLMVVGIVGTTEEGAIDDFGKMRVTLKNQKKAAYFHADGAYGGYFCSMLRDSIDNKEANEYFDKTYYDKIIKPIKDELEAVALTDSIAIDPHKLGYVPYAAGAVFFADTCYKDFLFKSAPYLAMSDLEKDPLEKTYLGGWTLEGSRAGATALACALSTEVISLDKAGYGKLMAKTIQLTQELKKAMEKETNEIKIVPIYEPHTNIVCFAVTAPEFVKKPKYLSLLTNAVIKQMSITPERVLPDYQFVTSKTDLKYDKYKEVIDAVFKKAEIIDDKLPEGFVLDNFKLEFLRTVIMHPTIANYKVAVWSDKDKKYDNIDLFDAFVSEIRRVATSALPNILLEIIKDTHKKDERIKILWIENKKTFDEHQRLLQIDGISDLPAIGKYFDITFYNYHTLIEGDKNEKGLEKLIKGKVFDYSVIDLNLANNDHTEWISGQNAVNVLYPKNQISTMGIPILFSKFFHDENRKEAVTGLFLSDEYEHLFPQREKHFLPKKSTNNKDVDKEKKDEEKDIYTLIKCIYQLSQ